MPIQLHLDSSAFPISVSQEVTAGGAPRLMREASNRPTSRRPTSEHVRARAA